MKRLWKPTLTLTLAAALLAFVGLNLSAAEDTAQQPTPAPLVHGRAFVDQNGDGYNDLAPDHDGDGIPNGQDPDWTKGAAHRSGATYHHGWGRGAGRGEGRGMNRVHGMGRGVGGFVDENGDGYNDRAPDQDGDGIPNGQDPDFVRGTGMGRGLGHGPYFLDRNGNGVCDRQEDRDQDRDRDGSGGGQRGGNK